MTISITPAEAGANILRHVENRTLRQRIWHSVHEEIACLLGAIHQEVDGAAKCPAEIMPLWLAECTVTLFDGISATEIYPIAKRYGELVASGAFTHVNNLVRDRWLINVVEYARDAVRPMPSALKGWSQVDTACEQVIAALRMGSDNPAAKEAWSVSAAAAAAANAWAECARAETKEAPGLLDAPVAAPDDIGAWSAAAEAAWSAAKAAKEAAEGTAAEAAVAATWRATTATALVASTAATTAAAAAAAWSAATSAAAIAVALAAETETSMVAWTVVERAAYSRLFTMLLDEIEASDHSYRRNGTVWLQSVTCTGDNNDPKVREPGIVIITDSPVSPCCTQATH